MGDGYSMEGVKNMKDFAIDKESMIVLPIIIIIECRWCKTARIIEEII